MTAHFNRLDICEAYYCFASDWHDGQGTWEYAVLGRLRRIGFRPSDTLRSYNLNENARAIYLDLVSKRIVEPDVREYRAKYLT